MWASLAVCLQTGRKPYFFWVAAEPLEASRSLRKGRVEPECSDLNQIPDFRRCSKSGRNRRGMRRRRGVGDVEEGRGAHEPCNVRIAIPIYTPRKETLDAGVIHSIPARAKSRCLLMNHAFNQIAWSGPWTGVSPFLRGFCQNVKSSFHRLLDLSFFDVLPDFHCLNRPQKRSAHAACLMRPARIRLDALQSGK